MKFDAEFLQKNLFWVLLLVAVPLALLAFVWLSFPVAGAITAEKAKVDEALKKVQGQSEVKSEKWNEVASKVADQYKSEETKVWQNAYEGQKDLMEWPTAFEAEFQYRDGLFAKSIQVQGGDAAPPPPDGEAPAAPEGQPAGEDPAEGETPAPEGETPPAGEPGAPKTYNGVITDVRVDYILVKGKEPEAKKFRRVNGVAVSGGSPERKFFSSLREGDRVLVTYEEGKYFGDELTDTEMRQYHAFYSTQVPAILEMVQPVDDKGKGVVQFPGWVYRKGDKKGGDLPPAGAPFFNYKAGKWAGVTLKEGSREAWTAQEDLWIQREIFRLVRTANDYVADFSGKGAKGTDQIHNFENPYWKVAVKLTPANKLEVQLTNKLPRRQRTEIELLVKVNDKRPPVACKVEKKPPLNGGQTGPVVEFTVPPTALPTGVYGVSQALTWEMAAVKRIDRICIGSGVNPGGSSPGLGEGGGAPAMGSPGVGSGMPEGGMVAAGGGMAHSHRTLPLGLQALFKDEAAGDAMPMDTGGEMGDMGGVPMAGGVAGQGSKLSTNGFDFKRYVELTPQARRLPLAVALIVDQEHVGRVQAAFTNSKLRFLTTQVLLNRYPNSLRPNQMQMFAGGAMGSPGEFGAASLFGLPDPTRMGGIGMGSPGEGGYDMQNPLALFQASDDERQANMELVLYGIVSLYERYPPRLGAEAPPE